MKNKLICLTPVKNEEWILDTFLSFTSEWADYIIIADQGSIDDTKQIALKYEKVIYVENKSKEYNEAERQLLLIKEARKISGPKILFTLDADELLSLNYRFTNDWKRILNSAPGDVFGLQWANINPDKRTYNSPDFFFPWIVNDDGCEHKNYVSPIHSMRIPFPDSAHVGWNHLSEFKVLHFNYLYSERLASKNRYYQCIHYMLDPKENPISLFRSYNRKNTIKSLLLPDKFVRYSEGSVFDNINMSYSEFWWDNEVIKFIENNVSDNLEYLNIWMDCRFKLLLEENQVKDKRTFIIKCFHYYLNLSQVFYPSLAVSFFDKLLSIILKNIRA